MLPQRELGRSGISVSTLSLGSWQTFERIPRADGLAVMLAAREAGIDFLDDARYDDPTGKLPLRTGYSEVVFGELFRAAGWRRDEVVVANKLWFEFWPGQDPAAELDGSLQRLGFDYLDLEYCASPPPGLDIAEVVQQMGQLISSGKLRAWGVLNWPWGLIGEAARLARDGGLPPPCAAQLPYSLVRRSPVEDPAAATALDSAGVSVVASAVLSAGALTQKYAVEGASGRIAGALEHPRHQAALTAAERLGELAARLNSRPATLALVFALANPRVASALFGATQPTQVAENVAAAELLGRLDGPALDELRNIGVT